MIEAHDRAKQVLIDFKQELLKEHDEMQKKAERHLTANKVFVRALNIMKDKLVEAQSQVARLDFLLKQSQERVKQAEHTIDVLRWHMQHGSRSSSGISTPPDVC